MWKYRFFEGSQVSPAFDSVKKSVKTKTSIEHCGNEDDSKNLKIWEKELSQCHFVHQKSHTDCPTNESGSPPLKDENSPELCLYITLFKSYWRNIAVYNIYIINLQTIMIRIGPLRIDQRV
jgi:hypothetical protein